MQCPDPTACGLDVEVAVLKQKLVSLESWTSDLDKKVDQILEILNVSRGGWLMFMKLCAAVGVGAGLVVAYFKATKG